MDINNLIQIVIGSAGFFVLWKVISFLIDYLTKSKIPYKFCSDQGYAIGKFLYNRSIKNIPDKTVQSKMIELFDKIPDAFNVGFDAGIRGLAKPEIKQ